MSKKITSLDVKYKGSKLDKKTLEAVSKIYNIETRHAIIMAINTFGSSNIKRLAKILGKNDATIYYHIKELIKEPKFLQLDEKMTHTKKGIFYKLTDLSLKVFFDAPPEKLENIFGQVLDLMKTKSDEEIATFYFDLMAKVPDLNETVQRDRRTLAYNHILENFMINNIESINAALKLGEKPKNKRYPIGSISISSIDMKISTPRHLFEILNVIAEFFGALARLQTKIEQEMTESSTPEDEKIAVHYHMVGGEVAEFEFEK